MGIEAVAEAEDERSRLLESAVSGASSSSSSSSLRSGRGRFMGCAISGQRFLRKTNDD